MTLRKTHLWLKSLAVAASVAAGAASFFAVSSASAAPTDTLCTPVQVVDWGVRVHVRCSAAVGGVVYFATPTSDAQHAARVLSLASTALVAGRTLVINYDPADTSGASFGCQANDCRVIRAIGFGQ
jgi:hypothetical protein